MTDLTNILWYEDLADAEIGSKLSSVAPYKTCNQSEIVSLDGTKGAKTWINHGEAGYGDFGYTIDLGSVMTEGDELWWTVEQYFPTDFDFTTDHGSLKWFRVGRLDGAGGSNKGYIDCQITPAGNWRINVEYKQAGEPSWEYYEGGPVEPGTTQVFEVYVKFGVDDGIIKMYRDGVLFAETQRQTIGHGDVVSRVLLCTYWNGHSPKYNEMFLRRGALAVRHAGRDDTPYLMADGQGGLMIGDFTGTSPVPPPIDPPIDPPVVEPQSGTTMHVDEAVVYVQSDLPVVVLRSDGKETWV